MSLCLVLPVATGLGPLLGSFTPHLELASGGTVADTQTWKDISLLGVHRPPLPSGLKLPTHIFRTLIVLRTKCK